MTAPQTIDCPKCGGTVSIRAAGYTVTVACDHCGSVLDVSQPAVRLIKEYRRSLSDMPLPLGQRGVLGEVEWEAIGTLLRSGDGEQWYEVLLFNPYEGYAWLVLAGGEWQFGRTPVDQPDEDGNLLRWRGQKYVIDGQAVTCRVERVAGEFYWRVKRGDAAQSTVFRRGRRILSREEMADEVTWTCLEPISNARVAKAFGVAEIERPSAFAALGEQYGAAPAMDHDDLAPIFGMAMVTAFLAWLVMLLMGGSGQTLYENINVPLARPAMTAKLGTITVTRPFQFVKIRARSELVNRWVDLDYSLVNRATQRSIDGYGLLEFYAGTDSDGNWTEGNHTTTTLIAGVPRGTYDLYVDAEAHAWPSDPVVDTSGTTTSTANPWANSDTSTSATLQTGASADWNTETIPVSFEAWPGGLPWGNFWSVVALLLALPAAMIWWRYRE